jgi:hypothetical protein
MYTFLVAMPIFFIGIMVWAKRYYRLRGRKPIWLNVAAQSAMLAFFATILIAQGIGYQLVPTVVITKPPVRLAAIADSKSASGIFIIGSGSVADGLEYDFYVVDEDGTLRHGGVYADDRVHIKEDPTLKHAGYLTVTTAEADSKSPFLPWSIMTDQRKTVIRQVFRVPVGTVATYFDMKR